MTSDPSPRDAEPWSTLLGQVVVLDLASTFVCLGRLADATPHFLLLEEADIHDLRDSPTSREKYVLECRLHGVRINRQRAWVRRAEIVSVSRLEDVNLD